MLRETLQQHLIDVLTQQAPAWQLPTTELASLLNIERPRQASHGHFAVNVSPLARFAKVSPPQIAQTLLPLFAAHGWQVEAVGGFLNFTASDAHFQQALYHLANNTQPGLNTQYQNHKVLLEFVSANPTGPLHIGHGRWVALGDSIGRILRHCGATVVNEFYINDAGSQMFNIANSLWYRCLEILETGGKLPEAEPDKPYPFYAADYVIDLAKTLVEEHRAQLLAWDSDTHIAPPEAIALLTEAAKTHMLAQQRALMERCGLTFDVWFSERSLHDSGAVSDMMALLAEKGVTYQKEGATWFASAQFGDDQDRVLVKSDGSYTYLTADIAYHYNKYQRNNRFFNCIMNIWGADHHGYIPRMKAAMQAVGEGPDKLEILLGQLVNLIVDGERTRMGKRKKMLTLEELVDEVGVDAVRFWMVSKSQDTTLDFDVDLAASASDENPVYYVQYAHARCCSILRNAHQTRLDTVSQTELPALLQATEWQRYQAQLSPEALVPLLSTLENEAARERLIQLLLRLDGFEQVVLSAGRLRSPHILARYLLDLAADFHSFYAVCRVLVPQSDALKARLTVIDCLKRTLAQGLTLLGVSAPEQM